MAEALPSAKDPEDEKRLRALRKDGKVDAILHERYPVRFWDTDLGPEQPRLYRAEPIVDSDGAGTPPARLELHGLTDDAGEALRNARFELSADGRLLVSDWLSARAGGNQQSQLVVIDTLSGARRMLLDLPGWHYPLFCLDPQGAALAVVAESEGTPSEAPRWQLLSVPLDGSEPRCIAPDWDGCPASLAWSPDGQHLYASADHQGRAPVFAIDPARRSVTRLTLDDAAYADLCVSPCGRHLYALRHAIDSPPLPVRLDLDAEVATLVSLRGPCQQPALPGRLTEVDATGADGARVRAWLALPAGASAAAPAALLLWVHGGPLGSWNGWSWRWNPWLAVARGYAVLMPDPALSTGYGRGFIQRGGGAWGDAPYQDLLAISDAAQARDDIDGQRSAAMGGSFGGYMANWIAGHTDRFRAIVSHASLWTLSQFGPTTDAYHYWRQEIGAQMLQHHSPHRFVRDIRTPMLIIHGDKDYPVPIGEALSLWAQLAEQFADEQGRMPHKFLYYPGENHWILARRTPRSGTRRCSPSSPNTSMAKPGNAPRRWDEAAAGTAGKRPAVDPLRRARRRSRAVRRRAGDPRRAARLGIVAAVGTGRAVCAGGYAEIRQKLGHSFCNLLYLKD
ncbi:S9 family peptidase [Pseudomonas aeruginosa]|nr:S9 family peptidase [Pseudomonas aeruginosa]